MDMPRVYFGSIAYIECCGIVYRNLGKIRLSPKCWLDHLGEKYRMGRLEECVGNILKCGGALGVLILVF